MSLEALIEKYGSAPDFAEIKIRSIHTRTSHGDQMIHMACVIGDIKDVAELIALGADVMSVGEEGYTPLHYAIEQRNLEVARYLIGVGADMSCENFDGETPGDLAKINGLKL